MAKLFRTHEDIWWYRRRRRTAATSVSGAVSAAASLGGLTATAGGIRTVGVASASAAFGRLVATASGTPTVHAAAAAQFGGLTATAQGRRTTALGGSGNVLNPQVYLVDRTSGALSPLGEWGTLNVSPIVDAVGSCSLAYPVGGSGFDTLLANVGPTAGGTVDQEIEVRLVGTTAGRTRWLLQQKEGDDLTRGSLWTFTGASLEQLLAEVFVGPQNTATQELTFSGANAGQVLAAVFDAIVGRAATLLPGMTRDFTTTHDSAGVAWSQTVSDVKFGPTDTLLSVAQALTNDLGMCEFRVSPDHVLQAYEPGGRGRGRDLSTGAAPLRFAQGTNLAKADRRESARVGDAATAVLAKGSDGVYEWVTDATAEATRGRRVEASHDAGQLTSAGAVTAAGQTKLDSLKFGVSERSHGIVFGPGSVIPGVDFDVADWALSFVNGAATRLRVAQWTASFQRELGQASGTVTMNDVIAERVVALQRQLTAQSRGGAVVGTSSAPALVDDGKSPAAPTGLTASSSAYLDADGAAYASITAAWSAVTTNADATPAGDIVGYLVRFAYTGIGMPTGWNVLGQVAGPAADWDGVVAGKAVDVQVAAVDQLGHVSAWSTSFSLTTAVYATPPPVASAPDVDNFIGVLRIVWDGKGVAAEPMPANFLDAQLYGSQAEVFDVDDPGVILIGSVRGAGTYAWSPPGSLGDVDYGITWFVRIRTRNRNGNAADLSDPGSAVPGKIGEGDVAAVNIGVLTAGILNSILTIGNTITTGEPGESRVQIDTTGLYAFNEDDVALLSYSIATSVLSLLGTFTVGQGVASGDRIQLTEESGYPTIFFYDALSGSNRAYMNGVITAGNRMALGLNSGVDASGNQSTLLLLPSSAKLQYNTLTGTPNLPRGGVVAIDTASAKVSYAPSGTDVVSLAMSGSGGGFIGLTGSGGNSLGLFDSGISQLIGGGTGNYFITSGSGSAVVSGGTVKSFVIEHPTDPDRWLVHACTEGPTAGVEYTGTAVIQDHLAVVELPAYFEALTDPDTRTIFLQPELATFDGMAMVPQAAPSEIKGGRFHIVCPAPDGTRVHWQVKAARRGITFAVEPLRSDVTVAGDGPYRWIVTDPT